MLEESEAIKVPTNQAYYAESLGENMNAMEKSVSCDHIMSVYPVLRCLGFSLSCFLNFFSNNKQKRLEKD